MSHYTYMVTNKLNGKVYVGSHSWKGEGLDPDYYGSGKIIKRAVEKYGKENFQVEVLYYYDTVEECRADEERILTEYNVKDCPYSYNCKNAAVGMTSEDMKGHKHSDATRQKMSQAQDYRKTPVVAIDKNGNVKIFKSQQECSRVLNLDVRNINSCLKGRCKTCGGYLIKYLKRCSTDYKITKRKGTIKLELPKDKKTPIVVIQKDTGKIRMFESQNEGSRVLGIDLGSINGCLKGRKKTCKGYIIKYLKRCSTDYKITKRKAKKTEKIKLTTERNYRKTPIVAIQKDTGKIKIFKSIIECARQLNLNPGNISNCLKGRCKSTGGYTFKYIEQLESGIYEGITDLTLEPSKRAPTPVIAIQKDTGRVRMFLSQIECSRVLGIHPGSINKCIKGRRKSAGGYTLKRINRDKRVFKVSPRSKADI